MAALEIPMRKTRGFTLVELLVVIGIIALLISILLPALSRARRSANTVKCLSNLRQVGTAFQLYAADFKGAIPVVRQDTPDDGSNGQPTNNIWWTDLIGPYVTRLSKITTSNVKDLDEARRSVIWGCSEWNGRNATLNQYDTGYGMNAQFYARPDYPAPGDAVPKNEFAMRWLPTTYPGKYYKLGSIRYGAERVLVADSLLWFLNARISSGGGVNSLPGQPVNPSTTNASSTSTPGLMDFDFYRHSKVPPAAGTYFQKTGTVACNAVYCDGHAETITSLEQGYKGIFMREP
jgi:prepilin-type N-terminal cleavage/methylation domain-containing protein/prepilin-type processing-associated H-X9-DG protein